MSKRQENRQIPKLRYNEFKSNGEWDDKALEDMALFFKGKGISKAEIDPNGILPCIRYGELYTHYTEIINSTISFTNLPPDELVLSKPMDVIIPSSGETREDIANASCILKKGIALGGDINIIRSKINGIFLSYYLTHVKKREIAKLAQGDAVVHLYSNQLKKLKVSFPKQKEEQKKIASCLSSLDDLITAHTRKLGRLKAHKKGLLQLLFPASGKNMPKLRFAEFKDSGEWKKKMLGECLMKHPDYGLNAPAVPYSDNLPTYLRITDISDEGLFLKNQMVSVDKEVSKDNYLDEGDIVLARTGASVGKSYKYRVEDGRLVFAGFLIRIKPHSTKLNSELLFQFLSTDKYWQWVNLTSTRSGQPGINGNEYALMPISVPPTEGEQQKIANCFYSLDKVIIAETSKIDQLKNHKKGLIQGLFPNFR
jgi:type I restriction enzyme S subunit